ncbi:MAG: hypothetical protein ACXAEU_21710 [Candidatus Hodarchaeales archaeon]|jgi:hypothetical protein
MNWWPIAKNEYRLSTSRIREIRPYLPYLLVVGLALYVFILAPVIVGAFVDDFWALLLSQAAVVMVQYLLFMIFIFFFSLPITSTLQDIKNDQLAILLSAPVKPGDIMLGEFIGKIPIYATFATLVAGLFTALLTPIGLDVFQTSLVIIIFVVNFLFAFWSGTLAAIALRTVLMKTSRGKDIGKGLAFIVILPPVAMFYFFLAGYMEALRDPAVGKIVQDILSLFPSSWGSEVIVEFARNPGDVLAINFLGFLELASLFAIFLGSLYFGSKLANLAYSLEPSTFSASKAEKDGIYYIAIKNLGGRGPFGLLLSLSFKTYFRKFRNISQLFYALSLAIILRIIMGMPEDSVDAFFTVITLIMLLGLFVLQDLTTQGKENLLLYKQTPTSTVRYVGLKLYQYLLIILPITVGSVIITTLMIPDITVVDLLVNIGLTVMLTTAATVLGMGIFLLNPGYHDKAGEIMINGQILVFGVAIGFFISIIGLDILFGLDFFPATAVYTVVLSIIGLLTFYAGMKKLENIE